MSQDKFYWDSCAFLAYLQDEEGADLCELVLDAAEKGEVLVVTSALTIAEVLNLRGKPKIAANQRADVVSLFAQEYIHVRNVTRRTAEIARDLFWDHDIPAKDAVHVATALEAGLPVFNTFDDILTKRAKPLEPRLRVEKPFYVYQTELPGESIPGLTALLRGRRFSTPTVRKFERVRPVRYPDLPPPTGRHSR